MFRLPVTSSTTLLFSSPRSDPRSAGQSISVSLSLPLPAGRLFHLNSSLFFQVHIPCLHTRSLLLLGRMFSRRKQHHPMLICTVTAKPEFTSCTILYPVRSVYHCIPLALVIYKAKNGIIQRRSTIHIVSLPARSRTPRTSSQYLLSNKQYTLVACT
jgi:hypothetical protein